MNKRNSMFDVAFTVIHTGEPEDVSVEQLLDALQKRIDFLRDNPGEAVEAFGICDSFETERET